MSDDIYAARRERVMRHLDRAGGALVIGAAPELRVGPDGELRYQPDADLFYLTGYTEPDAVLVLAPSAESRYTMFVRPRDPEAERWNGVRGGVDAATSRFGAGAAYAIAELRQRLPELVSGATVLYAAVESGRPELDAAVRAAIVHARRSRVRSGRGAHTLTEPDVLLAPMRQLKDAHEIERLRAAAEITIDAFGEAARVLRSADGEWQVEAALEHGFRSRGASGSAFAPIVAGGANTTVLHYISNDAVLRQGELLLIDAGARHRMYCADVTRTYPVNGRFTAEQRAMYEVVLAAHSAAVSAVRPGAPANAPEEAALRVLVDGMIGLGLLHGAADEVIEQKQYRRYFPHRTSHWLGLDVHDAGAYVGDGGEPVPFAAGMVLTVEPGLYVPPEDEDAPPALRGIGIRLEDDVLVTESGAELLTDRLPIAPDDVERMIGG